MFIYSVRASTVRFFLVIALALSVLLGALYLGSRGDAFAVSGTPKISFEGVRTPEDRIAFLKSFGMEAVAVGEEESFLVPSDFDRVLLGYNEVQKAMGLDLGRYSGKRVSRFVFEVKNTESYRGAVYATLLIYRNRVVGADISSASPGGFVLPLTDFDRLSEFASPSENTGTMTDM